MKFYLKMQEELRMLRKKALESNYATWRYWKLIVLYSRNPHKRTHILRRQPVIICITILILGMGKCEFDKYMQKNVYYLQFLLLSILFFELFLSKCYTKFQPQCSYNLLCGFLPYRNLPVPSLKALLWILQPTFLRKVDKNQISASSHVSEEMISKLFCQ